MKWQKTKVQFLLKNSNSGMYYARLFLNGKEVWRTLKTDVFSVAQARLAALVKESRSMAKASQTVENGKATVEEMAKAYLGRIRKDVSIKTSTVHYREQLVKAILKSWPELTSTKPKDISETDCETWASGFSAKYSPTRYNNSVDSLRAIFEEAAKAGMIFRNPVANITKRTPNRKHLELPSREDFNHIVVAVRGNGAWCSQQCGDLIEFLAYSGCRLDESRHLRWADVEADSIWIHGGRTGIKKSERRQVPIIAPMRTLLDDLKTNPRYCRDDSRMGYVLAIRECQKAIDVACIGLKIKRFTHHDLRHLFATRCIESRCGHSDSLPLAWAF